MIRRTVRALCYLAGLFACMTMVPTSTHAITIGVKPTPPSIGGGIPPIHTPPPNSVVHTPNPHPERPTPEPVPRVNPAAATNVIATGGNVWLPDINWFVFGPLHSYSTAIKATVSSIADRLFLALVALDMLINICRGVLANEDFFAMMSELSVKLITFNVAYWLLVKNGFVLAMVIISSFSQVGLVAGHSVYSTYDDYQKGVFWLPRSDEAPTDPLSIIAYGIATASGNAGKAAAYAAFPDEFLGTGATNIMQYDEQINLFAVMATVGGYVFIAGTLTLALFEAYIVLSVGILMTGFLGSRWTQQIGVSYFSYAISVGVKLMMVYLCLGLAAPLSAVIYSTALFNGLLSAAFAGISAMICWAAPNFASSLVNGSSRLNFTNFMGSLGRVALAGALLPKSPLRGAGPQFSKVLSAYERGSLKPLFRSMPPLAERRAAMFPGTAKKQRSVAYDHSLRIAPDRPMLLSSGAKPGGGASAAPATAPSVSDRVTLEMVQGAKFVMAFGTDTENSDSGVTGAAPIRL